MRVKQRLSRLAQTSLLGALLLIAAVTLAAQASGDQQSVRTVLKGYDPVAYFNEKRPVQGLPDIRFDFDGARYLFSTPQNRQTFASDPDRYAPQFSGLCTVGMAMGMRAEADPNLWAIVDGRLYVFASPRAKARYDADPGVLKRAHDAWQKR